MNRLKLWEGSIIQNDLVYKVGLRNIHAMMKLKTIVLKSTVNSATSEPKDILYSLISLEVLTNQKPKVLRTRKAIAAFNTKSVSETSLNHLMKRFISNSITSASGA